MKNENSPSARESPFVFAFGQPAEVVIFRALRCASPCVLSSGNCAVSHRSAGSIFKGKFKFELNLQRAGRTSLRASRPPKSSSAHLEALERATLWATLDESGAASFVRLIVSYRSRRFLAGPMRGETRSAGSARLFAPGIARSRDDRVAPRSAEKSIRDRNAIRSVLLLTALAFRALLRS